MASPSAGFALRAGGGEARTVRTRIDRGADPFHPFGDRFTRGVYPGLTTLVHHRAMKNRGDMSAVIEGLHKHHALLAAYLQATDKIDWRALQKRVAIGETPEPAIVDVHDETSI